MTAFESVHSSRILGKLAHFDRMIFKGHLTGLYPCERFRSFLCSQGVLLKDFAGFAEDTTEALMQHARDLASKAGRPFQYLDSPHTPREPGARRLVASATWSRGCGAKDERSEVRGAGAGRHFWAGRG